MDSRLLAWGSGVCPLDAVWTKQ